MSPSDTRPALSAAVRQAIYDIREPPGPWLKEVCRRVSEHLAPPLGVFASLRLDGGQCPPTQACCERFGISPIEIDRQLVAFERATPEAFSSAGFRVGTLTEVERSHGVEATRIMRAILSDIGAADLLIASASTSGGRELRFAGPWPAGVPIDGEQRATWRWLAVHLAAATQLREMDRTPRPTVLHVAEHAPAVLRPDIAGLWSGLVDGSWSLVQRFTTGGRRFLVAVPNDEGDAIALTRREEQVIALAAVGHSNKVIAFRLELSASTVASHLRNALAKLGLSSRVELVQVVSQLVGDIVPPNLETDEAPDFARIEEALDVCARELGEVVKFEDLDPAARSRVRELRSAVASLRQLLPTPD